MIIDLKTGGREPWHKLQVAAYANAMPWALEFEPTNHVYSYDGRVIPSVTQIFKEMGLISEFAMQSEFARERGLMVHIAGSFLPDRLDFSTVDPRILGYVLSAAEWFERTACVVEAQEQRVYLTDVNVAGTLDLRGKFDKGQSGTLYLQADGSLAKFEACDVRNDWQIFVSIVNFWRWKHAAK